MKQKVTIQDIADALGISRNTVSKAINNSEGLAEGTRDKILQKAVEMGYKQFSYVQTLTGITNSKKQSVKRLKKPVGEIALLTRFFPGQSHFASLMLDRFHRELSQLGYTMSMHLVEDDHIKSKSIPLTFVRDRISGIICIEMFDWDYDDMICDLGIPTLFIDGPCKRDGRSLPADQLYMENTVGITKLVSDMIKAGKKRIGFIGNYEHCESFFERYMAMRGTVLLAGETVRESHIVRENRIAEMKPHLQRIKELPDLFICANDFVAIEALQAFQELGISVPEDVMLCGFDDSSESRLVEPSLTTVHIHTQIMAYSAAHLLLSRIEEPSLDYRTIYTETDLICRDSTTPVTGELHE